MTYTRKDLSASLREGKFTSLGSYPKFWVTADGSVLSYEAIMQCPMRYLRATGRAGWHEPDYQVVGCDVNWEDRELYCDDTGERIESAYAEEAWTAGAGQPGCLYDWGPERYVSKENAISAAVEVLLSDCTERTKSRVRRDLEERGIHYFDRRLRPFIGHSYVEVSRP